jgi:hypothetical protein
MPNKLPEEVVNAWSEREGPLVLATVDNDGIPNAIYALIVNMFPDGRIAVVDNFFNKTKSNIDRQCKASVLFIAKGHKSYQVKGNVEYYSEGPVYQQMLTWADPKYPCKGVVIINPEDVYRGADLLASWH